MAVALYLKLCSPLLCGHIRRSSKVDYKVKHQPLSISCKIQIIHTSVRLSVAEKLDKLYLFSPNLPQTTYLFKQPVINSRKQRSTFLLILTLQVLNCMWSQGRTPDAYSRSVSSFPTFSMQIMEIIECHKLLLASDICALIVQI